MINYFIELLLAVALEIFCLFMENCADIPLPSRDKFAVPFPPFVVVRGASAHVAS